MIASVQVNRPATDRAGIREQFPLWRRAFKTVKLVCLTWNALLAQDTPSQENQNMLKIVKNQEVNKIDAIRELLQADLEAVNSLIRSSL
ncbi:MAG: hypothetical protein OEX75_09430, partial [Gammaproteobacteria bacterium]|nr:hypothetical protein [Gammaproteobacteria bacterium]